MALTHCIDWVMKAVDVPGIQQVTTPGNLVAEFPCIEVYAGPGEFDNSTVSGKYGYGIHEIYFNIHYPFQGIAENLPEMWEMIETIRKAIRETPLNNYVHAKGGLSYQPFAGSVAKVQTHGVVFTLTLESEDGV